MNPAGMDREAAPPTGDRKPRPQEQVAVIGAFKTAATDLVGWHHQRAEALERKAANLLGLCGLALTLTPFVAAGLDVSGWNRMVARGATGVAAVALAIGGLLCVAVLRPRTSAAPDSGQLMKAWADYFDGKGEIYDAAGVEGMSSDSLLRGSGDTPAVLSAVKDFADSKGRYMKWASRLMGLAVIALAVAVLVALIGTSPDRGTI